MFIWKGTEGTVPWNCSLVVDSAIEVMSWEMPSLLQLFGDVEHVAPVVQPAARLNVGVVGRVHEREGVLRCEQLDLGLDVVAGRLLEVERLGLLLGGTGALGQGLQFVRRLGVLGGEQNGEGRRVLRRGRGSAAGARVAGH